MRKTFIIFLIVGGIALGVGLFNNLWKSGQVAVPEIVSSSSSTVPVPLVIASTSPLVVTNPTTLSIPKLGVQSYIEHVGLNSKGAMDIPKNDDDVAWYNLGAKPGEKGSAVIAGHLDTKTGAPAVFWDLNKLKEGDEISVSDSYGKEVKFKVIKIAKYEQEKFPLQEVFASNDKPRLNLITCEGSFNSSSKLYSHRLVVYAEGV